MAFRPFKNKSKNPTENDKSLYDWAQNLKEDGQSRRTTYEAQWYENIATYCGDLWAEYDLDQKKLVESDRPEHKVRLPINLAQPAVRTEYAKLLKNRPIIDCLARADNRQDINSAKVGDAILNNYIEFDMSMPKHRRRMLQWVLICGLGGLFTDYDAAALGDQEVLMGPQGSPVTDPRMIQAIQRHYRDKKKAPKTMQIPLGEVRIAALSPFQIIYDFSKVDFNEAWWCIVSEVYDVDDVYRRWGVEVDGDKDTKPGVLDRRTFERWDMHTQPIMEWRRGDTQKLVEVSRLYVRPGHRDFPNGTEIVFTDAEMIFHQNFPWGHNLLPVALCGHVPAPWSQFSTSIVQQIKPLALEISKTESQMIENRNLMSNPPWIEYVENKIDGEIVNRPGIRLTINYMPNVPEPHPIEMPEIPTYVKDLIPILKEHVLEISGQSEVSQGKVPAGARAGVTIAYLQEEDDTKLGPTVTEFEECMERTAWLQLQVIAQEYDIPRTMRIYKPHSEPEILDFYGDMLQGIAGVRVQAGSALPRSKAAKQQFILDLWDRKLETDPRKVRDMLELSQGEPDEWEKDIAQAERENRKIAAGIPIEEAEEWQNHPAHHYQHRDYMKSPEYEDLDDQRKQAFRDHDESHSRWEREQQQQLLAQQQLLQGGGGGGAPPQNAGGGANGVNATPQPQFSGQPNGSGPTEPVTHNVQDLAPSDVRIQRHT